MQGTDFEITPKGYVMSAVTPVIASLGRGTRKKK